MEYGCIAEKLGHSFSKMIHARLGEYPYELCELAPNALEDFFRKRDFRGINVTIPYKERVIPYLDSLDAQAQIIGAVNTIVCRDGKLKGYNTDFYGMTELLRRMELDLFGKKVAVLGTGGTSKTACAVASALGAKTILRVSRHPDRGCISYQTLEREHADIDLLINTTPCGMFPNPDGTALSLDPFSQLCGVADAVYNPLRPQLVLEAQKRGIPAQGGLFMLVAQAVRASELFLDTVYPSNTVQSVFSEIRRKNENLVLCGMPGCGKSTVGAALAQQMGRPFLDLDRLITESAGKPISQIFCEDGEEAFRNLETAVLKTQAAQQTGAVIATGGGAILRAENVDALRRNGRLYFLDRPLRDLLPTADRPLSSDRSALQKRYEERYEIYCRIADRRIAVHGDVLQTADAVRKDFEQT